MFTKRFRPMFLRFVTDEDEPGGGDPKVDEKPKNDDLGFPANTPVKEMTPEQQAAYWKDKARKHEKRAKPESFDADMAELEAFRAEKRAAEDAAKPPEQKDLEQQIAAAVAKAEQDALAKVLPSLVRAEFARRLPHLDDEGLDELMSDLPALESYTKDGKVDVERVERMAKRLAPREDEGDDKSNQQWNLGHILSQTQPLKKGMNESMAEAEARTLAKYQQPKSK